MVFSSPIFLFLFLPVVLALHLVAGARARNLVLLVASLAFYAWGEAEYALVMLASILANDLFARWVARARARGRGRLAVGSAVVFNLGLLGFYKYAGWLHENLSLFVGWLGLPSGWLGAPPDIHLPLGISFYTFQALSAVIDVYRGDVRPARSPLDFALYIALFPQLIAGPIVRYRDVAAQIVQRSVTFDGFALGVRRFVLGLAKKALVANSVAMVVDELFAVPPERLSFVAAWIALIAYGLQVYYDFSGYSDMAIGLGHMLGFRFLENFDRPFLSRSITEFWRRWHISLSTWFRDYVYIPMGGNRRGRVRTYLNLALVFALVGLWHGAAWSFVVFGLYHGALMILERLGLGRWLERRALPLQHLYCAFLCLLGWAIFRGESLAYTGGMLTVLFDPIGSWSALYPAALFFDGERTLAFAAGLVCLLPWGLWAERWRSGALSRSARVGLEVASSAGLIALFFAALLAVAAGTYNPFIYFRF